MIKASIIGASGYTGYELVRLLAGHKEVEITGISSRTNRKKRFGDLYPSVRSSAASLLFEEPSVVASRDVDLLFSALPHGASMEMVRVAVEKGIRVIDLSADFRLRDAATYEEWYVEHTAKGLLESAVYGLPELYREDIKAAQLVANPGCYPTAAILSLAPLLKNGLNAGDVIIDSMSGLSGAGRSASIETSFVEINDSASAYKVGCHRHTPEMEQELSLLSAQALSVTFTPHLVPVSRGILSTSYAELTPGRELDTGALIEIYRDFYSDEPFVRVLEKDAYPNTGSVRGSNFCDIGLHVDTSKGRVVIVSAIDNLTKGASGQAVQNMNILFGFNETEGLLSEPLGL